MAASDEDKKQHLCVIVHGLWGNPKHLTHVATALRNEFSEDVLHILVAERNTGNFTYDGIELGGERLTHEIEEAVVRLEKDGKTIKRFSIVGYSLGGLVARFAIGLLHNKGWFDKVEPVNFTTFASPHLGVRTPYVGFHNQIWNILGSRTLSTSGQQLFTVDNFRDSGRPLLSIMADSDNIFIEALSSFKNKSLYANIVNDRAVPYYTAAISETDPFTDLEAINIKYVPGYEDVILDSDEPAIPKNTTLTIYESLTGGTKSLLYKAPFAVLLSILLPIGSVAYLINSGIQNIRSAQRIKAHQEGRLGIPIGTYALPPFSSLANGRSAGSVLYEQGPSTNEAVLPSTNEKTLALRDQSVAKAGFPALALTTEQLAMVKSLNKVGFQKYLVHIHKAHHSHAAIVVRTPREAFAEGKIVSRHWLERFEV